TLADDERMDISECGRRAAFDEVEIEHGEEFGIAILAFFVDRIFVGGEEAPVWPAESGNGRDAGDVGLHGRRERARGGRKSIGSSAVGLVALDLVEDGLFGELVVPGELVLDP